MENKPPSKTWVQQKNETGQNSVLGQLVNIVKVVMGFKASPPCAVGKPNVKTRHEMSIQYPVINKKVSHSLSCLKITKIAKKTMMQKIPLIC